MRATCLPFLLDVAVDRQDTRHPVVAFVARVFVERTVVLVQGNLSGPGLRPCCRIADREPVVDRVRGDAGQSLDQAQAVRRPPEVGLAREVRRLDDQRVALPMATRVAVPLPDMVREWWASVQRDDSRGVDHLHQNYGVVRCLEDLKIIVVEPRQPRQGTRDASLGRVPLVGAVHTLAAPDLEPSLALRRERRHPPVGRVDDEGGASVVNGACAAVPVVPVVDAALGGRGFIGGRLGGGQRGPVGELSRAFERGDGAVVPYALQIRCSPGCTRHRGGGRLCRSRCRYGDQQADEQHPAHDAPSPIFGVVEAGRHLRLPLEPGEAVRVVGEGVRQELQRDLAVELRVGGLPHLSHAALADEGGNVIMPKAGAGLQRHGL